MTIIHVAYLSYFKVQLRFSAHTKTIIMKTVFNYVMVRFRGPVVHVGRVRSKVSFWANA